MSDLSGFEHVRMTDDWAFSLERAIRSSNSDSYKLMYHIERAPNEIWEDEMDAQFDDLPMEYIWAEMCDLLRQACTGDALPCIRAIDDRHRLATWQRLHKKCISKFMTRVFRLLGVVVSQGKGFEACGGVVWTSDMSRTRSQWSWRGIIQRQSDLEWQSSWWRVDSRVRVL